MEKQLILRWLWGQIHPNHGRLGIQQALPPESLGSVHSSLVPTNKSYLAVKKELSCCFGGSGGGSDGLFLFLIDAGNIQRSHVGHYKDSWYQGLFTSI